MRTAYRAGFTITKEIHDWIHTQARLDGVTMSDFVQMILERAYDFRPPTDDEKALTVQKRLTDQEEMAAEKALLAALRKKHKRKAIHG